MGHRILLIGAGHSRELRMDLQLHPGAQVTTLDINPLVAPDVVHDLDAITWPFNAGTFAEVHAYEVLEHLGRQGDAAAFFATFSEVWRVLEPDGYLCATCPSPRGVWAWGDPGHTRVIARESLVFLDQTEYARQLDGARATSMSDYRGQYFADFTVVHSEDNGTTHQFVLRAVKPSRHTVANFT